MSIPECNQNLQDIPIIKSLTNNYQNVAKWLYH